MIDKLSMEQNFSLAAFAAQVEQMSPDQAKKMLIEFHKISVIKEAAYKKLIEIRWGMDKDVSH